MGNPAVASVQVLSSGFLVKLGSAGASPIARHLWLPVALVGLLHASSAAAQSPSAMLGAYAARHGVGIEITGLIHRRGGLQARLEISTVERAAWIGVRMDPIITRDVRVYIAPLVGSYYCYPNNLSGTGSGCPSDADWKSAATVLGGIDLFLAESGRSSVGIESGYRFVDAGSRSRWVLAATWRYRIANRD